MILCKLAQQWYLSTGIDTQRGLCWLRCGLNMPHLPGFQRVTPPGMFLYGCTGDLDAITFYPVIRYKGVRLESVMWKVDSNEPVLYCRTWWEPGKLTEKEYAEVSKELESHGWRWDLRDGIATGYIHVDELEKIEGPPPEGAF